MFVARIAGTVVCTRKVPELEGFKLLVVRKQDLEGRSGSDLVVAVDVVGAGDGEQVLVVQGSSARQTERTNKRPVDAAIVGIVDCITLEDARPSRGRAKKKS